MTLLAGFKAMLLARTGRSDICVATAMANRSQQWTERVIGPMENTTIIRTRMDSDLSFREALSRVRDSVLEAYARQELALRDSRREASGRRRCGSSIAYSSVFRPSERDSPAAQAARCGGPIVRKRSPGRAAGPADRSHLAYVDAQGETVGHCGLMHLSRTTCSRPTLSSIGSRITKRSWPKRPQTLRCRLAG